MPSHIPEFNFQLEYMVTMAITGIAFGGILANLGPTAHELCGGKLMSLALGFATFFVGIGVFIWAPVSG